MSAQILSLLDDYCAYKGIRMAWTKEAMMVGIMEVMENGKMMMMIPRHHGGVRKGTIRDPHHGDGEMAAYDVDVHHVRRNVGWTCS